MKLKRRLTPEELSREHDVRLIEEQSKYPGRTVEVTISRETDDDGMPLAEIIIRGEFSA